MPCISLIRYVAYDNLKEFSIFIGFICIRFAEIHLLLMYVIHILRTFKLRISTRVISFYLYINLKATYLVTLLGNYTVLMRILLYCIFRFLNDICIVSMVIVYLAIPVKGSSHIIWVQPHRIFPFLQHLYVFGQ